MILVREIMSTAIIDVAPEHQLATAIEQMEFAEVRHLIVKSGGRLAGILSDRDIAALAEDAYDCQVKEAMTAIVYTVSEEDTAAFAGRMMLERSVSALPVTNHDGEIVGIVTTSDYVRYACDHMETMAAAPLTNNGPRPLSF